MRSISTELADRAASRDPSIALPASRELFSGIVEPLADSFDPAMCDAYADSFSQAIARCLPDLDAAALAARYRRVREVRPYRGEPRRVTVLSRVTLGADIAVTSVVLDALKRRFPTAEIVFAGPRKSFELFAADPRLRHVEIAYGRGDTLRGRLSVFPALLEALAEGLVVDPDSRLTQLGLLPACEESRYRFFESRSYGAAIEDPLPVLTARWLEETFAAGGGRPYIAPASRAPASDVTVSFGVGENLSKRVADPFEEEALRLLAARGTILIDKGAGGEEAGRVERAVARAGARVLVWDGAFAPFAAAVSSSGLYVGYDSAGGHAASAAGVPLVSVFAGFPSERFLNRWRPRGTVIRAADPASTLLGLTRALAGI